jgi:hypothetical protein
MSEDSDSVELAYHRVFRRINVVESKVEKIEAMLSMKSKRAEVPGNASTEDVLALIWPGGLYAFVTLEQNAVYPLTKGTVIILARGVRRAFEHKKVPKSNTLSPDECIQVGVSLWTTSRYIQELFYPLHVICMCTYHHQYFTPRALITLFFLYIYIVITKYPCVAVD